MIVNSVLAVKGCGHLASTVNLLRMTTTTTCYLLGSRSIFKEPTHLRFVKQLYCPSMSSLLSVKQTYSTSGTGTCGVTTWAGATLETIRSNYILAPQQRKGKTIILPLQASAGLAFKQLLRQLSDDVKDSTYLDDEHLTPNIKIEKQLMKFMDMWELDKAIKLLRLAVSNNIIPNQTVVLNLLQQLANLGEVNFLVDMHQFLLEEKLCSDTAFYRSLQQAYFNSGRVEEGVDFLRKIYHLTRCYQDVDIYFVLLSVMILRHFPDKEILITQFVKDLGERVPEDHEVRGALWKSYILTEHFEKATDLCQGFMTEMKRFLPIMINDIILQRNKVEVDRRCTLLHLVKVYSTIMSQKQLALLYGTYSSLLVEEGHYQTCLEFLDEAKNQNIQMKKDKVLPLFTVLEMAVQTESESNKVNLQDLKHWIQTLE